jgi:RNA polymerase sigma-70 factor, ECF subfamily
VLDYLRQRSRRPRTAAAADWLADADGVQATSSGRLDEQVLLQQLINAPDPQRREAFVATQLLGLSYE